ncbi:g12572 [Coccomyxa viridis]|uniref:G12572 protein n=1 Tax=Coccomyxa viridis TaxID=1274662 RepID=A0ABP1GAN7_9CHLO
MEHSDRQQPACCSVPSAPECSGPRRGQRRGHCPAYRGHMPGFRWSSRRSLTCAALCLLFGCLQLPLGEAVTPLTSWQSGIATNYGGPLDGKNPYDPSWGTITGSCGYGKLDKGQWPYWSVAALSSSSSFSKGVSAQGCGECFEIKCMDTAPFTGRCITGDSAVSVIVQITDACPECAADHIDIQALTFNKLAPMNTGRINIQYRRVECVPPKPMVISVDSNGGQGAWLRLFVEQAGGLASVKNVQVRTSGSTGGFQSLTNKWGSDWETPNAPAFPLDINIVGADGEAVTAYQVIQAKGATGKMSTQVQFKISNPSDQSITASVSGGSTSTAKGDSLSPASSPSGGSGDCTDTPPSGTYTCEQQKAFNACSQSWMISAGYCKKTCGKCSGGSSSSSPSGSSPSWYSTYGSPAWAQTGSSPKSSNSPSWYSTYGSPAWAQTGSSPGSSSSPSPTSPSSPKSSNSPSWYSTGGSPAWANTGGSPSWYSTYSSPAWAVSYASPSGRKLLAATAPLERGSADVAEAAADSVSEPLATEA